VAFNYYLSQRCTKACVLEQNISVWGVCSHGVNSLLKSRSAANRWQATTGTCNVTRTCDWLWCCSWEILDNHPSSPDLEPSRSNPFKFTYNTSVHFVFTFYKKITYLGICKMPEVFTLTLYCRQIRSVSQLMFSIFLPSFGVLVRRPFVFLKLDRL
jgi:hypothetical protein